MAAVSLQPSLLRDINTTLELLYDQDFQEEISTVPGMIICHPFKIHAEIITDPSTARCIQEILKRACALAYPKDRISLFLIESEGVDPHRFTIKKSDYNYIEGRISSVFLDKLRDFSHVYLHYLRQGWNSIPRDDELFRDAPDTNDSLYMEKKEHYQIVNNQGGILRILAEKAGCEVLQAQTHVTGHGLHGSEHTTRLHGTEENLSRFFRYIEKQAENVIVKVPLWVIRASQIEGPGPIQSFLREKNEEFLEKSRSFLMD